MLPMEEADDEDCRWWQVDCRMGEFGSTLVGDAVENLAASVLEAVADVVGAMATFWIYIDTINLTSPDGITGGIDGRAPTEPGTHHTASAGNIQDLLGWATWICLGICVLSLIALGANMALKQRRGEGAEHGNKIGIVLVATVLISAAAALVTGVLPSSGPEEAARPVAFLQTHLWWYMGALAVVSVLVGAARMVWEQRADPGKELLKSLLTLAVVSGAGVSVIGAAVAAADGFAQWLIEESTDLEFGDAIVDMLVLGEGPFMGPGGLGAFVAVFFGIFVIFFSFIQLILMIIRAGMLVLLAGIFPLAASFTNTEMGKQWFKKCCSWLLAFILYKPAAAIIYATAFQLVGSSVFDSDQDDSGILNVVVGLTMLLISLIAMPALMKFVAPMASMGGGGVGGAMAGVAGAVGGQVASGAMKMGQNSAQGATSGGGSGGGTGAGGQAPSGAGGGKSGSGAPTEGGGGAKPSGGGDSAGGGKPGSETAGGGKPTGKPSGGAAGGGAGAGAGAGGGTASGAAGGAAAGAGGGHPAIIAAQKLKEVGDGIKNDAKGAVDSSTKGPDGSGS